MATGWTIYAVQIGSTVIDQIESQGIDPAIEQILMNTGGGVFPRFSAVTRQVPMIRFSTTKIDAALTAIGMGGLVIDQAGSTNGVTVFFRKRVIGAGFAAGSSHLKAYVNLGLMTWGAVRASAGGNAVIDVELTCLWDETNSPIVTTIAAADALTPTVADVFTVGPWWVNTTALGDDIVDFTLNGGFEIGTVGHNVWPTNAHIRQQRPSMQCTSLDAGALKEASGGMGLAGKTRTGNTRAFLRKRIKGLQCELDAAEKHIEFDVAEGRIHIDDLTGNTDGDAAIQIVVTPNSDDGSNDPIAYTPLHVITGV
jgi:hypothetical protein